MRNRKTAHLLLGACAALALTGCARVAEEVTETVAPTFNATLVPVSGGGSGTASVSINDVANHICTELTTMGIGAVTSASIRLGPTGPVYVNLDRPDDDESNDCDDTSDAVIDHMRRNPGAYYVEVRHTGGTLRGRLRD